LVTLLNFGRPISKFGHILLQFLKLDSTLLMFENFFDMDATIYLNILLIYFIAKNLTVLQNKVFLQNKSISSKQSIT